MHLIKKRVRFFLAVEGLSEQSFIKWLQILADGKELGIHLHIEVLGGGGFRWMLERAFRVREKRRRTTGLYRASFLLLDSDRENAGDWSLPVLKAEAMKRKFILCVQRPNFEGLLVRMLPGFEGKKLNPTSAMTTLRHHWPNYEKPANAESLKKRFSADDLQRAASCDRDLRELLTRIGFCH